MVFLTEPESRYYNDLFTLCDVEKIGKVSQLKCTELFRSSQIENSTLSQVRHIAVARCDVERIARARFHFCIPCCRVIKHLTHLPIAANIQSYADVSSVVY